MVYEPREDSYLLEGVVEKYARGNVLDMGAGSGILAEAAARRKQVRSVVAVDIDKDALSYAAANVAKSLKNKIKFLQSDLFANIKPQSFDTIIFNPPYLPSDTKYPDNALDGGKRGYELIERFFESANDFLDDSGSVLLLFSSRTSEERVDGIIRDRLFEAELLETKPLFMEILYVYEVKKGELLKEMNRKRITSIKRFAKGHRGIIYTGNYGKKRVAIKAERKDTDAKNRAANEVKWLKLINAKGIGPKLLFFGKTYFVYEFIEGDFILDYLEKKSKNETLGIVKKVLEQCFVMDKLGVSKEEMHKPVKHVIIGKDKKPVLVDFERANKTNKPQNVTQFCQFLSSKFFVKKIGIKKKEIWKLAKDYKDKMSAENFNKIIRYLT